MKVTPMEIVRRRVKFSLAERDCLCDFFVNTGVGFTYSIAYWHSMIRRQHDKWGETLFEMDSNDTVWFPFRDDGSTGLHMSSITELFKSNGVYLDKQYQVS